MANIEIKNNIMTVSGRAGRVIEQYVVIDEKLWNSPGVEYNGYEVITNWKENYFISAKKEIDLELESIGEAGLKHVLAKTTNGKHSKFNPKGSWISYKIVTEKGKEFPVVPYHDYKFNSGASVRGPLQIILHLSNLHKNHRTEILNKTRKALTA